MRTRGYQNYLEEEVLSANPLQLVQLLFRGALTSIAQARENLRSGDIRGRSQSITHAMAIVTELSRSLNHEAGGELSASLSELYGYVQKLLIQANTEQSDAPLAEAETLMTTLSQAWEGCEEAPKKSAAYGGGGAPAFERLSYAF